jgi:ubiquinone/menaquinone biosynthesis C-methylase UbiE
MTSYDQLAELYTPDRVAYSNDLYNALLAFGLSPRHHVLDVGCGTGLASRPLIENGFRVTGVDSSPAMVQRATGHFPSATWVEGRAEALPFEAAQFDAAIAGQSFHRFDRERALAEMIRVLRPGGLVAVWWRVITNEDPVHVVRDRVARELGVDPPNEGLNRGFKEFYASPLTGKALRVLPWQATTRLSDFLDYERSRKSVRETYGPQVGAYFVQLEKRLREHFGENVSLLPVNYMQFVYVGRTLER